MHRLRKAGQITAAVVLPLYSSTIAMAAHGCSLAALLTTALSDCQAAVQLHSKGVHILGHSAGAIVGISCAILVLLFLGQSVGTSKLGHAFAPVLVLFFLSNAAVGIYNIVRYGSCSQATGIHVMFKDCLAMAMPSPYCGEVKKE